MRCEFVKSDGKRCGRRASKGQQYCWTHDRAVKADPRLAEQAVEPEAQPKTTWTARWHFPSLGGPEGLGVVEYGLPECKDEKLIADILATPYLQLISCHKNGTILNRFMAKPCAAKHHEHWRMGLPGLSSRFPENHFDVGSVVGPQPSDVVQAMERLVKGPIIRV